MPKSFQEWATEHDETPRVSLGQWIDTHPEEVAHILQAINEGYSWPQVNRYVIASGGPKTNHNSLRRALLDE